MAQGAADSVDRAVAAARRALSVSEKSLMALYFAVMRLMPEWLVVALVKKRARTHPGEESPERAGERVARHLPERPKGRLILLQSIGPGDSTANLTLMAALAAEDPALNFLVVTRTVDAQEVFSKAARSDRVTLMLAPHDTRAAVARFLDHWRPDAAVFCEGDLWPNMLDLLRRRGVPMALVNGQFNGRLGRLWGKLPGLGRWMAAHLDMLHVISPNGAEEAARWVRPECDVLTYPNLKMDAAALSVPPGPLAEITEAWGDGPVFFGASVAENEVAVLLEAQAIAARDIPGLKLILAPRWKEEGESFRQVAAELGIVAPRRSVEGMPGGGDTLFIADSYGEFGLWLERCFAAFMGHTMFGGPGHNPYEPIIHQRQIISGAIPAFLATDYQYLADLGLCHVADTPETIAAAMTRLWQARARGETGFEGFAETRGFSRDMARRVLALSRASVQSEGSEG